MDKYAEQIQAIFDKIVAFLDALLEKYFNLLKDMIDEAV